MFINVYSGNITFIFDFKISARSECRIFSFAWFPGVWILYAYTKYPTRHKQTEG